MASAACVHYLLNTMVSNIGNPEEVPVIIQMEPRTRLGLLHCGNDFQRLYARLAGMPQESSACWAPDSLLVLC